MRRPAFLSLGLRPWLLSLGIHLLALSALLFLGRSRILDLTWVTLESAPAQSRASAVEEQPKDEWRKPTPLRRRRAVPPPQKRPAPPPPQAPAGGAGNGAVRSIAQVSQLPHYKIQVKPLYPAAAMHSNIEGVVILRVEIDAAGKVTDVSVAQSLGFGCDEAAVEAVKQSTFTPAYEGGEPVPVRISIPFRFKLTD